MTLLVLRALGLGDLMTAFPALRGLARAFPRHRLVLAAPRALAPLAMLSGAVDEVLDAAPLMPLAWSAPVDVAVNLHGRGPESHRVLQALAPARLIAFAHPAIPESAGGPAWRADEHEVARWCRLLREHGIEADPTLLDLEVPPGPVPREAHGATLIHPGAAHAARRWPADRWVAVARAERARGRRVILTGGRDERVLARAIAAQAGLPERTVYAGETDVVGLARLVAAAGRVVCGDTGIAHLATALRVPSVVLFGPTAPARWGPPPDRRWHRVLWAGTTGAPNGTRVDAGLLRIRPETVTAALDELTLETAA
ncbi:MAG TPA: glycosyltransferase family 9 protein [Terriglobales bacterium]|nr:glycosyltransferase family 9 protein [Terriglobales bacterium]